MERDQIVREDFPTSRKGWDPDAVRAHLESIAARLPKSDVSLADAAAERVGTIVAAAEATAAEIEQRAEREAEQLLSSAREEADGIVDRAREEAQGRIEQAQGAVESLVTQAEDLRSRVGSLGESLIGTSAVAAPEAAVPGPESAAEPEIDPEPAPEPEPDPEPEPEPEPEPAPDPEPVATGDASTDDLIAQLRGGAGAEAPTAASSPVAAASSSEDLAAVRLVALNMAMDGAGRDEIETQIAQEFGTVAGLDALLDDVLARTGA